ncbi:MAG: hypothetical protein KatS3mg032_0831 [Cyclobacteriaceae bacterium]|nr:MAG: hypothetical protein KatS3mg032_0831 [Cyclobacteriaceae bacterium]
MPCRNTIWAIILFSHTLSAQSFDTLEKRLQSGTLSASDSLKALNILSRNLTYINTARSLQYARKALELAVKLADSSQLADAYRNLSNVYSYNESFAISINYLQQAMDIFTRINDSVGLGNCYISLGHTYRRLRQRQKELYYHRKAYRLFSKLNITERTGVSAHNLGESYYYAGNTDSARLLTRLAVQINRSINNKPVLSSCYKVMGLIYLEEKEYDSARMYFDKVLSFTDELGVFAQKEATITALIKLAEIHQYRGYRNKQKALLMAAAAYVQQYGLYMHLQEVYYQLAKAAAETNNAEEGKVYLEWYRQVSDSIRAKRLADWQNLIESSAAVYRLNRQNLILQRTSQHQRSQIKTLYAVLLATAVFIFALLIAIKRIVELQHILKRRLQIIAGQKQQLEQINATKDRFFSIVSHDLRSPLNSLSGFLELIKDHGPKLTRDELLKMIHQLEDRLTNTAQLTDNLLTWARLQMGSYYRKPEKLALKELVSNSCSVYRDVALAKNIAVSCLIGDDLTVYADRNQMAFVVRNLINNAIKFTPAGGAVKVEAVKKEDGKIELTIADTGVGIPPEKIQLLFRPGHKKISTLGTAGEKGTGLGLMLSYEYLNLNNASIKVKSEPGKGTEFTLLLPAPDGIDPDTQVSATEA